MKKYALDTNLYVGAFRHGDLAQELELFYSSFAPQSYLSSVVLHELLVGADTPAKARQIDRWVARPFKRTARVVTPTHRCWEMGAEVLSRMAREEGLELRKVPKSLTYDVLLAAACREAGITLITDNGRNFRRIQRFIRFEFISPWPG
jgi:predicted nucleic acid-binding protein